MYPDLAYLLNAVTDYPKNGGLSIIKTQGLFIACSIQTALTVLYFEIKPVLTRSIPINQHNIFLLLATSSVCFFAFTGSQILYTILYRFSHTSNSSATTGYSFMGALLASILGAYLFCRYYKLPLLKILDASTFALSIGYAIGRMGCHLSGDGDWGDPNLYPIPKWWFLPDWLWAFDYPHNAINAGQIMTFCNEPYCCKLSQPVYPTSFYESICTVLLIGVLLCFKKNYKMRDGTRFCLYLLGFGIIRFAAEFLKNTTKIKIINFYLSYTQLLLLFSIPFFIILLRWKHADMKKIFLFCFYALLPLSFVLGQVGDKEVEDDSSIPIRVDAKR
jgi:prolipoprotein diacylglyceryltransferase